MCLLIEESIFIQGSPPRTPMLTLNRSETRVWCSLVYYINCTITDITTVIHIPARNHWWISTLKKWRFWCFLHCNEVRWFGTRVDHGSSPLVHRRRSLHCSQYDYRPRSLDSFKTLQRVDKDAGPHYSFVCSVARMLASSYCINEQYCYWHRSGITLMRVTRAA